MFRQKARRISSKLRLKKSDREASSSHNTTPIFVDSVSSSSAQSLIEDDDTSSSSNDELLTVERPILTQYNSAPSGIQTNNGLDLLLSMEVQERLEAQIEREEENTPPRQTRIRFSLPPKPPRSKSSTAITYPKARPVRSFNEEDMVVNQSRNSTRKSRRSGWRLFGEDDIRKPVQPSLPIYVGSRVRLKLRPLPTFGYVKYIGPVDFASGEHIGVELDFGVGDCDGSVNGKEYFDSEGKRGIFLQRRELEAVQEEE